MKFDTRITRDGIIDEVIDTLETGIDKIQFNTSHDDFIHSEGQMYWDEDDKTIAINLNIQGVSLQVGQENHLYAVNKTGSPILNGRVVYISGGQGSRPVVSLAKADAFNTSHCTIAMATHDVPNNNNGYFTTQGYLRDVNTASFNDGDTLYLSASTAGAITNIRPAYPNFVVIVGYVLNANANNGVIYVSIHAEHNRFGDVTGGNYTAFEDDGTMQAFGNATCYRDEYPSVLVPAGGATAPDQVAYTIGGVQRTCWSFDGNATEERLSGTFEFPHDRRAASDVELHLHLRPSTTGSGNAKFFVDWEYSPANGDPQAQTSLSVIVPISANTQYRHILVSFATLPALGYNVGDKIGFNLRRTPLDGDDTYGADVILEQIAMHVEVDMLGSRQRYIK